MSTHPWFRSDMMESDKLECDKHFDKDSHIPMSLDLVFAVVVAVVEQAVALFECSPPLVVHTGSWSPCTAAVVVDST